MSKVEVPLRTFGANHRELDGKSVLITGGTGSFGRHFIRKVLEVAKPRRLIIFSRDEMKQEEMRYEFPPEQYPSIRYFIGDVRDRARLTMAMRDVDYVIHAAALKQVHTAEYNPFECIHTNVMGAENVGHAAIVNNVKRVVALSTDKAANPVNLYGASKLASDKIFVAANHLSGENGTRFSVVRYGNVMGSRGSVLPLFQRLIREGVHSLPITDARMTRFWITLDQGVNFVLSSLGTMAGGEVFVPKIPSMSVVALARALAPELPHRVIGIRPGEKLHEVMITQDDSRNTIELTDRYVILPPFCDWTSKNPWALDGPPMTEGACYSSDTNSEWLDERQLQAILAAEHA